MSKHKLLKTLAVGAVAAGAVSAVKAKHKVDEMKEDGSYDVVKFNYLVSKYLVSVKNDTLDLSQDKKILETLDTLDDMRQNRDGFDFNMDAEKYHELDEYLDKYIEDIKISNGLHVDVLKNAEDIGSLEYKFRQVLQTQKFILENYVK